jgi:hypothetical protein
MFDLVGFVDKAVSTRRCARVRSVANLMPVADTGCAAGSTTGIMAETSLRSDAAKESVAI